MNDKFSDPVTRWLTDNDTCFLIGAGCSVHADKPLIRDLTDNVLSKVDKEIKGYFDKLTNTSDRSPTIEDLINYLTRKKEILSMEKVPEGTELDDETIGEWLDEIKYQIVEEIDDGWKPSKYYKKFLERLYINNRKPIDIFSLNYDTLLEASLESLRLPYVDGFYGTNRAWFDRKTFDNADSETAYRLYKLHGSINWIRDVDNHVRRISNTKRGADNDSLMIYPSEQKYLQTQYGVYETLFSCFRDRLRSHGKNKHLVILGYSFHDEHINEAILDATRSPDGNSDNNLTVIAFVGAEDSLDEQKAHLQGLADSCESQINFYVGNEGAGFFIANATDEEVSKDILKRELWRFEKLVDLIAGDTP